MPASVDVLELLRFVVVPLGIWPFERKPQFRCRVDGVAFSFVDLFSDALSLPRISAAVGWPSLSITSPNRALCLNRNIAGASSKPPSLDRVEDQTFSLLSKPRIEEPSKVRLSQLLIRNFLS